MLLYTTDNSARLTYICEFISAQVFTIPIAITTDEEQFIDAAGFKINYSNSQINSAEHWIRPVSLLFENDIRFQELSCDRWNDLTIFFLSGGDIPFDIFAASFYLLSRYEEYLPHSVDEYGRYDHRQSLAYRQQFLDEPLINQWLQLWKRSLLYQFPGIKLRDHVFRLQLSYDIDLAWKYRHKGLVRSMGGIFISFIRGRWREISERRKVISNKKADPFESYAYLDQLHERYGLKPNYFFLVAAKTGRYDKNIDPSSKAMHQLISTIAAKYPVGVHPSWQSGDDEKLLDTEIQTLKKITGREPLASRQHYIRMSMPANYRKLIQRGIVHEHSMGYGSINGFRASVCCEFNWFDLDKNQSTSLTVHPYCFMESTCFHELKLNSAEAFTEMKKYQAMIASTGGVLSMVWHNSFLGTDPLYEGWKEIYAQFLEEYFL